MNADYRLKLEVLYRVCMSSNISTADIKALCEMAGVHYPDLLKFTGEQA